MAYATCSFASGAATQRLLLPRAASLLLRNGVTSTSAIDNFAWQLTLAEQRRECPSSELELARQPQALFVCVHNAGRSQMAAAWAHKISDGRVVALSAGSGPRAEVNPMAVEAMREIGIDMAATAFPKPLLPEIVEASTIAITMGCGDACPIFTSPRYDDWALDDPHGQGLEPVRAIRDVIEEKVHALCAELLSSESDRSSNNNFKVSADINVTNQIGRP